MLVSTFTMMSKNLQHFSALALQSATILIKSPSVVIASTRVVILFYCLFMVVLLTPFGIQE